MVLLPSNDELPGRKPWGSDLASLNGRGDSSQGLENWQVTLAVPQSGTYTITYKEVSYENHDIFGITSALCRDPFGGGQ